MTPAVSAEPILRAAAVSLLLPGAHTQRLCKRAPISLHPASVTTLRLSEYPRVSPSAASSDLGVGATKGDQQTAAVMCLPESEREGVSELSPLADHRALAVAPSLKHHSHLSECDMQSLSLGQ